MRPIGLGVGIIIAILLSVISFLFGLTTPLATVSLLLLLVGLWILAFGAFLSQKDRIYLSGWGLVLALLATFLVLPIQYTIGLVLAAIVALILVTYLRGSSSPQKTSRHEEREATPPRGPPATH